MPGEITVRSIDIRITADTADAINRINELKNALNGLNSSASNGLTPQMERTSEAIGGVGSAANTTNQMFVQMNQQINNTANQFTFVTKASNSAGKSMDKTRKASSRLTKTIQRLLLYRLIREALMAITNAFTEGLKMYKQFVAEIGDDKASKVFSNYTQLGTELKATLGVTLAGTLTELYPVLLALAKSLQFIAEAINQCNAALSGQGYYYKVNSDYVEEYSKALKEAKNQVMGFDELNKLSGSSNDIDASRLYEKTELTAGMIALGAAIKTVIVALAGMGLAKFISNLFGATSAVSGLTSAMGSKTSAIGAETTALALDALGVAALAGAITQPDGLTDAVREAYEAINGNPLDVETEESITQCVDLADILGELQKEYDKTAEKVEELQSVDLGFDEVAEEIAELCDDIGEKVEEVADGVKEACKTIKDEMQSVEDGFSDFYETLAAIQGNVASVQKYLDDHPLELTINIKAVVDTGEEVENVELPIIASKKVGKSKDGKYEMVYFADAISEEVSGSIADEVIGEIENNSRKFGFDNNNRYDIIGDDDETASEKIKDEIVKAMAGIAFAFGAMSGIPAFANGGFPSSGSMFIAGEAGPEIVGSINGRTGVASGEEVTGIRTAVYAIGEAIVDAINNKDTSTSIHLDDGSIYRASQRGAKRVGNSLISFAR